MFFGNNEDYTNPDTYLWFTKTWGQKYGTVYVGFDFNLHSYSILGGMNSAGLAMDGNSLPERPLNPHPELPAPRAWIPIMMLQECATVTEAIDLAKSYNWDTGGSSSMSYQVHVADATGDAVVISVGLDGELAFTRKGAGAGYLVSTNINQAQPEYLCKRKEIASSMLEDIGQEEDLTVEYAQSVLEAVHVEGAFGNTLYSNIFDLKNRLIYLWHFHQYQEVIVFNLAEELAKGSHIYRISELFSQEVIENADQEYQQYRRVFRGILILVVGIIGGLAFFIGRRLKNSVKTSQLPSKRKILQAGVLVSGLLSGLTFVFITGLGMANLLSGNYIQYATLASIAPVLSVLVVVGGYTVLVGIYNYRFRRSHGLSMTHQEEAVQR